MRTPARKGEVRRYFEDVVLAYEGDDCLTWPFARDLTGYAVISYEGRRHVVSRLVCEKVNGPPPPTSKHHAAHSCGRGHEACVAKGHLSWKTPRQNHADKVAHDTHNRGERQWNSKLTETAVAEIRSLQGNMMRRDIAEMFGVSPGAITDIWRGKNWAWLPDINDLAGGRRNG